MISTTQPEKQYCLTNTLISLVDKFNFKNLKMIPKYTEIIHPLLKLIAEEALTRRSAAENLAKIFNLF